METLVKSLKATLLFKTCYLAGILIKFSLFGSSWSFSNLSMIMHSHQLHCNQAPRKGASSQRSTYATLLACIVCEREKGSFSLQNQEQPERQLAYKQINLFAPFLHLFCIRNNKWQTFGKVLEVFMPRHWWHSSSSSCRVCSITVDTANKLGLFHLFQTPF